MCKKAKATLFFMAYSVRMFESHPTQDEFKTFRDTWYCQRTRLGPNIMIHTGAANLEEDLPHNKVYGSI